MRNFYGVTGYPNPPQDFLDALVANIMETDRNLISDVNFQVVDRRTVFQQPLLKASIEKILFFYCTAIAMCGK